MTEEKKIEKKATDEDLVSTHKPDELVEPPEIYKKGERLRWIDQARGFIMIFLVVTAVFPPGEWKDPENSIIMHYLFDHASTTADYMTIFDIGAAAFIFMLGMLMSVSFFSRAEKQGKTAAFKHFAIRYGMLLILGIIIANVPDFEFMKTKDDYWNPIVIWDVIISIAVAGIVSFPFIFIRDLKLRLAAGYIWGILYQILMNYAGLKRYAQESVHGGIFGTIFGYASISIVASVVGEYMIKGKAEKETKNKNLAIFGGLNLGLGILIAELSRSFDWLAWEASKRQVSFTHNLISWGTTAVGLLVFIYLDQKLDKELTLLQAFGMNPFFVYFIVEVPVFILDETVGDDFGLGWDGNIISLIVFLSYSSAIMLYLYKNKNVISTEKAALYFLLTTAGLAAVLLPLGVL